MMYHPPKMIMELQLFLSFADETTNCFGYCENILTDFINNNGEQAPVDCCDTLDKWIATGGHIIDLSKVLAELIPFDEIDLKMVTLPEISYKGFFLEVNGRHIYIFIDQYANGKQLNFLGFDDDFLMSLYYSFQFDEKGNLLSRDTEELIDKVSDKILLGICINALHYISQHQIKPI